MHEAAYEFPRINLPRTPVNRPSLMVRHSPEGGIMVAGKDILATSPGRRSIVQRLVLRRLVLLGTPLALAVLEIFHPQPSGVAEAVEQGEWFMWFHIIQVPLIGLIALAVYLLTEGLEGGGGDGEPLGHRRLRRLLQRLRCGCWYRHGLRPA
jgi:hypothetical protein